jgi:hypothetical protein
LNTFISASSGGDSCSLTSTNDTTVSIGMASPAFASVYYTSGWVVISNPQFGSGVNNNQILHGVKGYLTASSSGTVITGGAIAYFTSSGFELEVHGSGVIYQFVTISGCNIHGEDTNIANTMVKFILSGGATGSKNVTIGTNTLQGGGSSATGIDLTGVTGTVTVGLNDISLVGTRVVGYTGPPAYANNAAALAGGLSVGDVYRISTPVGVSRICPTVEPRGERSGGRSRRYLDSPDGHVCQSSKLSAYWSGLYLHRRHISWHLCGRRYSARHLPLERVCVGGDRRRGKWRRQQFLTRCRVQPQLRDGFDMPRHVWRSIRGLNHSDRSGEHCHGVLHTCNRDCGYGAVHRFTRGYGLRAHSAKPFQLLRFHEDGH